MIELQRARLLQGNTASGAGGGGIAPANGAPRQASPAKPPLMSATQYIQSQDEKMQRFFQRLQHRDDSRPESYGAPTVPTALSRRILQRQGVGYLDDTVGAIASAAADRFLATVLQQGLACRDQRLKGLELAKEAAQQRQRHQEVYLADADERRRRKVERQQRREKANLAAVEAAEALKKAPMPAAAEAEDAPKKKKKAAASAAVNGSKRKRSERDDDDDESYDSIDEEEEYYREYYGDPALKVDDDEEDEEDMLILRDLARPLQAWDFCVLGKEGMDPTEPEEQESEEEDDDDMDEDSLSDMQDGDKKEAARDTAASDGTAKGDKSPDCSVKTPRPSSTSPTPPASNPS